MSSRVPPSAPVVGRNVRRLRNDSGLSLSGLARRSGVAKATLASLESGDGNPTIATLDALADALAVPIAELVMASRSSRMRVVRGTEAERPGTDDRFVERFATRGLVEVYDVRYERDDRIEYPPHTAGMIERVMVHDGVLRVGPAGEAVELEPGDFLAFPADRPHVYEAVDGAVRAVLIACHPDVVATDAPLHPRSRG